jgi:lysozyme family protein
MADFELAVEFLLGHEGGVSVNAADPGGTTNFGISQRQYPTIDIVNLKRDGAKLIYKRDYWRFDSIASQRVANKLLDLAANVGPMTSTKLLQEALKFFLAGPIVADGILGHQTIAAIESVHEDPLVSELKARAIVFHAGVAARPGQAQFFLGWVRRDIDG